RPTCGRGRPSRAPGSSRSTTRSRSCSERGIISRARCCAATTILRPNARSWVPRSTAASPMTAADATSSAVALTSAIRSKEISAREWVAGGYLHTHSWDRPLDHADYYPYYALAADLDVPVAMQAGASGGMTPSECGRPMGIDRAALYFTDTRFVLSHTGWPWVDEAIALARKFPNGFIGTAPYPPRRWPDALVEFVRGAGRDKTLFGTNFPTVGHRQALEQVPELGLDAAAAEALLGGNARRVFARLEP